MFANALIGLREGLEAGLVVSILVAYLVRTGHRDRLAHVVLGVLGAIGLSLAFGALLTFTSRNMTFTQQEVFGGTLSIVAVGFVTWMVFWMRTAARNMRTELDARMRTALAVGSGAVALTAFLAVGREGLETALFLWAAIRATDQGWEPVTGAATGLAAAAGISYAMYRGALRLNLRRFFTWTGSLLVVVAGGVLAYGVHDLQEAGVLPGLHSLAFDVSEQVPPTSWYAALLKGTLNFSPATTWLQAAAWSGYVGVMLVLFLRPDRGLSGTGRPPTPTRTRADHPVDGGHVATVTTGAPQAGPGHAERSRRRRPRRRAALSAPGLLVVAVVAGCSTDPGAGSLAASGGAEAEAVTVDAGDDHCTLSRTELDAGITTFTVTNTGSQVTEVYVYAGQEIVTEKENVGPGTSYDLVVDLAQGRYEVACKPGMTGAGIRQVVTVKAAAATEADPLATAAVDAYRAFVSEQATLLVPLVQQLAAAVRAGDGDRARQLYASSREPWERIEPVAESFGDLDPRVDARETDLAAGEAFTGWHRLEKALWTAEALAPVVPVADQLLADVTELRQRVPHAAITATSIGNGAKELLDEVATGKVTGEEEAFSHTDLVDFAANVDGARRAFDVLRPLVTQNDPDLVGTLQARFAAVDQALAGYRTSDGFVSYDTVDETGRRELARVVDALAEPLSGLAAATVTG